MKCPRPKPGASVPPSYNWNERAADLIEKLSIRPVMNTNPTLQMNANAIFIAYSFGSSLRVASDHLFLRFGG